MGSPTIFFNLKIIIIISISIIIIIYCHIGRQSGNFIILHVDNETKAQLRLCEIEKENHKFGTDMKFLKNGFIRRRALPKIFPLVKVPQQIP
jgi:hypothetical protein